MKRIIAILVALMLMVSATAALADKVTVFTDPATGSYVTLEMEGEYSLDYDNTTTSDLAVFTVSREGVCPVLVTVYAKDTEDPNMNDMTEEQLQQCADYYASLMDEETVVTIETTPAGNKYINFICSSEEGSIQERYTIFEDFDMSRIQYSDGLFTEADTAFLAEVQGGLWVVKGE